MALVTLFILYVVVAAAHTYLAPLTTGPDELAHYEYVNFIARHGRLPLDIAERGEASYKSDQPPLYHLIAALPAALVDPTGPPYLKRVQDHNRRQLIERTRHAWGLYNTEDEQWPYRAEILRWHVGRWVAILFGAATIAVTFVMARQLFTDLPPFVQQPEPRNRAGRAALAAAAIIGFIPRFALTGSMLNYETTLAFFSALFLWMLLRQSSKKAGEQGSRGAKFYVLRTTHYALLTGLFAGLAITAKLSALIFPLEILIAYWLIGRHFKWGWKRWLRQVLISAIAVVVAVSWWFGFVIYQFNTIAQDGWWAGLLRPLVAADSSDATTNRLLSFLTGGQAGFTAAINNLDSGPPWEWLAIFYRTFWMVGIEQEFPLGSWGLVVMLAFCLLAVYGFVTFWRQNDRRSGEAGEQGSRGAEAQRRKSHNYATRNPQYAPRLILSLLVLHLAAAFVLPLIRYAITFSLADTAQGRHILFQTAPAFAILLIWGIYLAVSQFTQHATPDTFLSSLFTSHSSLLLPFLPALFLLVWSGVQLQTMSWAYLPPLPVHTASIKTDESAARQINDYVALLEADNRLDTDNRILRVDLRWLSTAVSPFDYLTEVGLVDGQGKIIAQWLGHPAEGRYPTRTWDVGDMVDDTAWLPTGGLDAGQYELQLKLLPTSHSAPLPDEAVELGSVTILNSTLRIFNSSFPFTGAVRASSGYTVWQNGQALSEPSLFRYRETVLVTLSPPPPGQQRHAHMVGLLGDDRAEPLIFAPVRLTDTTALFIVGPDWPTGDYQLQVTLESDGEEVQQIRSGTVLHVIDRWQRVFIEPPMQQRVEANFADQIELLGYDLNANSAEPGGGIPLTLYWQGLDWMGQDYTIFTKLLSVDDQSVHGGRDRLPREGYSTLYWAPGEIISDPFGVPVDVDAPNGIYTINVGLYKEVNGQAVSLPLVQDGQPIEASSINIGPIKIGNTPPGITQTNADPQVVLNQPFGDAPNLTLLGYGLTDQNDQPIFNFQLPITNYQSFTLTLYWRSESPLPLDYTTFVHLRNEAGEIVAQKDQPPLNGQYPTSLWDSGEIIADEIVVPLPSDLSTGDYQIMVGLYNFPTGTRLTVPNHPDNSFALSTLKFTR